VRFILKAGPLPNRVRDMSAAQDTSDEAMLTGDSRHRLQKRAGIARMVYLGKTLELELKEAAMAEKKTTGNDPLERKAGQVQKLLESVQKTAFGGDERDISGEISIVDQHDADVAGVVYDREEVETTRQVLEREAAQIEDAKKRKAEGLYGICEDCGNPIPEARLQAMPEATRCVECQRKQEAARAR
jgi:phage/conjugal plasmid C-4 type zinc finger TraR family protein